MIIKAKNLLEGEPFSFKVIAIYIAPSTDADIKVKNDKKKNQTGRVDLRIEERILLIEKCLEKKKYECVRNLVLVDRWRTL
jgi:hypothetical protein